MQYVLTDSLLLVVILDPGRSERSNSSNSHSSDSVSIRKTFNKGYTSDGEVSDAILKNHPLPGLKGGTIDLDQSFEFSDIDQGAGGDVLPVSRDKRPSKVCKKKSRPSKKNKTKRRQDPDDSRPDSDKDQFTSLHTAKEAQRAAERSSRKMTKKGKTAVSSDEENKDPVERREDSTASRQSRATKRAAEAEPSQPKLHPLSNLPPEVQHRFTAELETYLANDKKLANEKVRPALAKARRTMLCLKYNNEALVGYKTEHGKLLVENASINERLNAKLQRSKARVMRESSDEKESIAKVVNNDLWRLMKFINCKDDEILATEFVYKAIYDKEPLDLDKMYSWSETYKKCIRDSLYAKRNYAASQIKACAWKLFENGETLPTVEEVRMCIRRTNDVNNPREMKLFKWFWECLLPKVVGAVEWGPSVRYYNKISTYKIPNDPKKRTLITPSNEAMILTLWENQFEKWHELWAWSQDPANRGKKQTNRGGKFTSCEKGQCDYSGWSAEGIEAFNTYVEEAKAGRKTDNRKLLETQTLNELRAEYHIYQPDAETQAKANRARKRKKLANDAPLAISSLRVVRALLDEEEVSDVEE